MSAAPTVPKDASPIVRDVIEYIEKHYAAPISLRDVAMSLGYSPAYLTETFARCTGKPITAWIIQRRIRAAKKLFRNSETRVASVCYSVGFNDACYFRRQFIRHVGVTPGRYRSLVTKSWPQGGRAPM
jgi:AraC-like DNA-binding protein